MPPRKSPEPLPIYPSEERLVQELYGDSGMMKTWRDTAVILERNGLPKKDPLMGNRRYWPAVERWLKTYNGLSSDPGAQAPDGEEHW